MTEKRDNPSDATLLDALPPPVRALAKQGMIRRYRANTTLIEENDQGDSVFIVLSGMLRIFCADNSGREITLALYGPGEYVGEMSLDGGPRSASVATERASICATVSGVTLRQHLAKQPEFAFELIQRLIRRTRLATASARSLALLDAYGRLTRLLDSLAIEQGGNVRIVNERLTHLAIAKRIGCSRELVSRILKDLETGGYLALNEQRCFLLKKLPLKW